MASSAWAHSVTDLSELPITPHAQRTLQLIFPGRQHFRMLCSKAGGGRERGGVMLYNCLSNVTPTQTYHKTFNSLKASVGLTLEEAPDARRCWTAPGSGRPTHTNHPYLQETRGTTNIYLLKKAPDAPARGHNTHVLQRGALKGKLQLRLRPCQRQNEASIMQ